MGMFVGDQNRSTHYLQIADQTSTRQTCKTAQLLQHKTNMKNSSTIEIPAQSEQFLSSDFGVRQLVQGSDGHERVLPQVHGQKQNVKRTFVCRV